MEKVIRDGKVGVLISSGFGAGFGSWGAPEEAILSPTLIELVENEKFDEAISFVEKTWEGIYTGGVYDLYVEWVPEGSEFIIEEYDGSETLMLKTDYNWITV